jgi:hypothetical protein
MSLLPPLSTILIPLAALLTPALATTAYTSTNSETPKDNSPNCSCYVVSSGAQSRTPQYFQYHRFYEFRNLAAGLTSAPPLINKTQNASLVPSWQPEIFNSDAFIADWTVQNWSTPAAEDSPIPMSNSFGNIYIGQEGNGTYLSLRTSRLDDHQTASEIENQQKNLMHVSMRMSGRVTGSKGAVAGFFTYYDDDNESDIEILTNDPINKIHYTNQPSVDKDGNAVTVASTSPNDLPRWDEWQTHRIDWVPKNSYWYLNDKQVAANTYSVPRKPSFLVLNIWSNGGVWSGNMTTGGQAEFQIQWIEMAFNTSGPYNGTAREKRSIDFGDKLLENGKEAGCETVCKIDGVQKIGTPEIVSSNDRSDDSPSSGNSGLSKGAKAGIAVGVIIGVLAILALVGVCLWRKKKAAGKGEFEMRKRVSNADKQTR